MNPVKRAARRQTVLRRLAHRQLVAAGRSLRPGHRRWSPLGASQELILMSVTDGRGSFGYVIYVREDQFDKAARALEL